MFKLASMPVELIRALELVDFDAFQAVLDAMVYGHELPHADASPTTPAQRQKRKKQPRRSPGSYVCPLTEGAPQAHLDAAMARLHAALTERMAGAPPTGRDNAHSG